MSMSFQAPNYSDLVAKWKPILEHAEMPKIGDFHKRDVTAVLLENTVRDQMSSPRDWAQMSLLNEATTGGTLTPGNATGAGISNYDPILISLVRRAAPNLMAYDIVGVQPMTGPTGLIFAMRSRYDSQVGAEAFYWEANTEHSTIRTGSNNIGENQTGGDLSSVFPNTSYAQPTSLTTNIISGANNLYNFAGGMATAQLEALGASDNTAFADMAFSIEKVTVTALGRALKAEYTMELAQDLKAIHGLDAETELANILTTEILAEINRELIRTIGLTAVTGAVEGVTTPGIFDMDTDSNGRWSLEKFKGLTFQIQRECNAIAKQTRRGRGNILICSSDVASALEAAGNLSVPSGTNALTVDDTGNTFAGTIGGRIKVYIDPYAAGQYMVIGYKGSNPFDAGIFYCPYVPLQMVRAVGQTSFEPKIGFKTRYGIVANPFAQGPTQGNVSGGSNLVVNSNVYYRRILINNLF
jgi:hypothetical protein